MHHKRISQLTEEQVSVNEDQTATFCINNTDSGLDLLELLETETKRQPVF